jgi:hypothetical protein
VQISAIVHALSMICRFNGHCHSFYSVAQHSCLVADLVVMDLLEPQHELVALLHDATEAYLGDVVRPLKLTIAMDAYRELEHRWAMAIGWAFGLGNALAELPEVVKIADRKMLDRERVDLLADGFGRAASLQTVDRRIPSIEPVGPTTARQMLARRLIRLVPRLEPELGVFLA